MKTVKWILCSMIVCAALVTFQMTALAADTDALVVTDNGNVGIGTSNPEATLDVGGDIWASGLKVSGNVGIGTTTPMTQLELKSGGNADIRLTNTNDGNYWELNTRDSGGFDIIREGLGEVMSFDTNGNVGIGTSSPEVKLHINGRVRGDHDGALIIDTGSGYVLIGPRNASWVHFNTDRDKYFFDKEIRVDTGNIGSYNDDLSLRTAGTTRITVSASDGNVGIGTTTPRQKLHVEGNVDAYGYMQPSDRRWKMNIETLDSALELVAQLRGVTFEWVDLKKGQGTQLGVIAQEVEEVLPEIVHTDNQGYKSVDYSKLVVPLIESVKALKAENDSLKAALDEVYMRLDKIENK